MAEDAYRRYKEQQSNVIPMPREASAESVTARAREAKSGRRRRPYERSLDYTAFKATIASAVQEIKLEVREQHDQTRTEVQRVRRDVLTAVKESPTGYVKLACEFGALFLVFCLAVRLIFHIELVNTAFALFMLPALAVYWGMAHLKQRTDKRP
jgi:hypothetical protein